jgi:hypothetical protein
MDLTGPEIYKCTMYNIKMMFHITFIIIVLCVVASCINALLFTNSNCATVTMCEKFDPSTNAIYEKNDTRTRYEQTDLTSPNDTIFNNPKNLLTGQARRYLVTNNGQSTLYFQVDANMYIIKGSPFKDDTPMNPIPNLSLAPGTQMSNTSGMGVYCITPAPSLQDTPQDYLVYLTDDSRQNRVLVDKLTADYDQVNKLRLQSTDPSIISSMTQFNNVIVVFKDYNQNKEQVLLTGSLKPFY